MTEKNTSEPDDFDYEAALLACARGEKFALQTIYARDSRWLFAVAYQLALMEHGEALEADSLATDAAIAEAAKKNSRKTVLLSDKCMDAVQE